MAKYGTFKYGTAEKYGTGDGEVAEPSTGAGWLAELNRLAGTTNLDACGAANVLAGTVGLELVGALNDAAGTTNLELAGACNALAGTTNLEAQGALQAAT